MVKLSRLEASMVLLVSLFGLGAGMPFIGKRLLT